MKVAVCVFGESKDINRWWEDFHQTADVFVHSWDRTSHPVSLPAPIAAQGIAATRVEVSGLPSYEHIDERASAMPRSGHLTKPGSVTDHASVFDSMRRVLWMRRDYELSTGQTYDRVILTRPDLIVGGDITDTSDQDALYGELAVSNGRMTPFGSRIIIGSPRMVDLVGYAFNSLYSLRSGIFFMDTPPNPDILMYFYLRMIDVRMENSGLSSRILRDSAYGIWACEAKGRMEDYETL